MNTYKVTLEDGQVFMMSGNFAEASAGICVNFHDPSDDNDWQPTPYQTADARHSEFQAAELLAKHYATDDDDCIDVESVDNLGQQQDA